MTRMLTFIRSNLSSIILLHRVVRLLVGKAPRQHSLVILILHFDCAVQELFTVTTRVNARVQVVFLVVKDLVAFGLLGY